MTQERSPPTSDWQRSPPSSRAASSACSCVAPPRPIPQPRNTSRHVGGRNLLTPWRVPWRFPAKRAFIVVMEPAPQREPTAALVARLAEIQAMTTGQLRTEFQRLSGRPTGSWNQEWLRRKTSWLLQSAHRQASDTVKFPTLVPEVRDQPRSPRLDAPIQALSGQGVWDPRLPRPGTEIVRMYRGLRLTIRVREDGFEWNGALYRSLTALARAITGTHWSGPFFFGLRTRVRKS